MLHEDPLRSHVPADPEGIVALYEATNQPLVQPTGRTAQAAQAAVVALNAEEGGYEVMVVLTLTQTGENIIYAVPEAVAEKELPQVIEEALNFAESMGFILDALGWTNLDAAHRQELIDRMPAFRSAATHREEQPVERAKANDPLSAVARLFAAFALLLGASSTACGGMTAEQRGQAAEIHQQLGDNLLREGDPQQALKEYMQSMDFEETPEAHHGIGLIYAWSLGRPQDGEKEFKRALEMKPDFSEVLTNLGALYISRGRFQEAIEPLERAARDPLYKSGQAEKGVGEIRAALQVAPKYCLGWRQLGTIFSEQGKLDQASAAFARYAEECPDVPDAHLQSGKVLARLSKAAEARAAFQRCAVPKQDKDKPVSAECAKFLKELGSP